MDRNDIKVGTVKELQESFLKIFAANGGNPLWAVDTLEYEFYTRKCEAKEYDEQVSYIQSLRHIHGRKKY